MKDDNNWKIKECKIKCPNKGEFIGTRTGGVDSQNDVLVMGFVKECFKEFNHIQFLPMDIISLICKLYIIPEMIHFMRENEHYGIYLKHILASLC